MEMGPVVRPSLERFDHMDIKTIKSDGDYVHVALCGRLDTDGVKDVESKFQALVSSKAKPSIVDLTECSFLASMGMRMLLGAAKALRAKGARLVLYNPQPLVLEALETAGFGLIMPIELDFANAIALIKG